MPSSINLSECPEYIYGLHDIGGQVQMLNAKRIGWLLDSVDLRSQIGTDYTRLTSAGLGVIVRLNNGFDPAGTIPPSDQYATFAAQCAAYVSNSPGPRIWIIGNEMNSRAERPQLADGAREIITPELYALCFLECRTAIKKVPGHADDWVIPGAVAPYNDDTGDWVQYLVDVLNHLDTAVDGITLHCYTHDFSTAQITSDVVMDPPYDNHHCDFRAYRDFLNALPARFRTLPVFISETCPYAGWDNSNIGWIQAAYKEIAEWNADPAHQPIQALILFRWQTLPDHAECGIQDKLTLLDDFGAALNEGYRVRWTPPEPVLVPTPAPTEPMPMIEPAAWLPEPVFSARPTTPLSAAAPQSELPVSAPPFELPVPQPTPAPHPWAARFLAHDTPVGMVTGQTVTVNLRVRNAGAATWLQGGAHSVHVGFRWFNAQGEQQLDADDRRTALPSDVSAHEEITLGAVLVAPKSPGIYTLRWDLVAAGITRFADADNPPLDVPVCVTVVPKDITGWRAEASENPAQVARALDGDPTTFWDSGIPQRGGQWFRLNLCAPRRVDGIQFLSPGKGFPVGYVLRISADGKTWTEIARVASGNRYNVLAVFAPMQMQYAQIDLLAESETQSSWMISEILIHSATAWSVNASHNASAANGAIDNRTDTAWTSGTAQTPGMWFQIDLGRTETVSGLALVPPANENPAGFRVTVWNASASRWQVAYEKTNNTARVDVAFAATQTQFINIQLLQASHQQWAIQHTRVVREMEMWLGPTA